MATYAAPIPGAAGYEQANLLARRAYENAMTRLQQQRSQTMLKAGYRRDAQGKLSVDPNNEYGGYQQMLRGESAQTHGLERAQHASGWGEGSGYLGAQADELQHAQGGEQAAFGQDFENTLAQLGQGETDAAFTRDQSLYQNELDAAREAIDKGNFNPADYSGLDVPDYGAPPAPVPKAPARRAKPVPARRNVHQRGRAKLIQHAKRSRGRRR